MLNKDNIKVVFYNEKFADNFAKINYCWLKKYNLIEDIDRKYLDNPEELIINMGGEILFLQENEEVLGTCALIHHNSEEVEIAKLAVMEKAQGKGYGKTLVKEAIRFSKKQKYKRIFLISNTKLEKALRLYETVGFKYKEVPENKEYETADIYMELDLSF